MYHCKIRTHTHIYIRMCKGISLFRHICTYSFEIEWNHSN